MVQWCIPALVAGMFISCRNDLDKVAAVEIDKASPDRITHEADYLFSDSGRVRNRLQAGRIAEWATEPRRTELSEGVRLEFLGPLGEQRSVLTARRGIILPDAQRMEVHEHVVFINAKGERLETEQLTWLQDSARVFTDKAVRVERGRDIIHGHGLDAAEDFSRYTIRKVTGVLQMAADDTLATR